MTDEELFSAALKLKPQSRAELASQLLESLESEVKEIPADEWEEAWGQEAARRLEELREGKGEEIPGDQVLKELRKLLA
jgi:putative addiction module component (TIGR02574 family)